MIILADREDGRTHYFYVVDGHTHIGKEAIVSGSGRQDFRTNTAKQTVDFYIQVQNALEKMLISNESRYCYTKDPRFPFARPLMLMGHLMSVMEPNRNNGWIMDQFVAFPFSDVTQTKERPRFKATNDMLVRRATTPAVSLRVIPFCRVDPHDGDEAVKEVRRAAELGARGLKLHPISQNFLDELLTPKVINVVKEAVLNRLPVLFDCRYFQTGEELYQLAETIKPTLPSEIQEAFKLIIGHSCMEYQKKRMFEIIEHPNLLTETSGLRSNDIPLFFRNLVDYIPDIWADQVVYGSDFNYFTTPQTLDVLSYLFSWQFRELGATPQDIQRILGLNLLSCLRTYAPSVPSLVPPRKKRPKKPKSLPPAQEPVFSSSTIESFVTSEVLSESINTNPISSKVPSESIPGKPIDSSGDISSKIPSDSIPGELEETSLQNEDRKEKVETSALPLDSPSPSAPLPPLKEERLENLPQVQEDVLFTPSSLQRISLSAIRPELANFLNTGKIKALILDESLTQMLYSDLITLIGGNELERRVKFLTYEAYSIPKRFSDSVSGVVTFSKHRAIDQKRNFKFMFIHVDSRSTTLFTFKNSSLAQPKLFSLLRRYYPAKLEKILMKDFDVRKVKREEEYRPRFKLLFS